jgi:hypothetical protein
MMETTQAGWAPGVAKNVAALPWCLKVYGYPLVLVLITVVATLLRFHALGDRGLWLDEVMSVRISHKDLPQLFQALREREINMAFYYVLLHFWMKIGSSEAFLRSMSVIFSVATVPFIYAIGSRLFGRNVGLIAAWLLAVNAFHVRYAQEIRAYALFALLVTISTYFLVRNIQEPQAGFWACYGILLALTLYTHILGLLIILAHCASIVCLPPREIPWKNLGRAGIWLVALTLPLAVIVPMIKADPLDWLPKLEASLVLDFLVLTAGNRGTLLLVLEAIGIAIFLFWTVRALIWNGRSKENWGSPLVLFWFFLPFVILLTISAFRPFFVPRFLLPCLPAFLLAASVGLTHMRPRSVAWTLGGAISMLCIAGIAPCYHLGGVLDDWRAISFHILSQSLPGDRISFYPEYASTPFEYYRDRQTPVPEWPAAIVIHPGDATDSSGPPGDSLAVRSQDTQTPTRRLWVVFYSPAGLTPEVRANLAANLNSWQGKGWPLRQAREFADVSVLVFVPTLADAVPSADLPVFCSPATKVPHPMGSAPE